MSQNDYVIANQTTPLFRADLNAALQALASNSSGATAPATTYANMLWYDTANNILKMRSEADDAWIDLGTLDQSANTFTAAGVAPTTSGEIITSINPSTSGSVTLNSSFSRDTIAWHRTGNLVTAFCGLKVLSVSSPSGTFFFDMPFSAEEVTGSILGTGAQTAWIFDTSISTEIAARMVISTTSATAQITNFDVADLAAGDSLSFSVTYITNQ